MRGLRRGVSIELEPHSRVAGAHDPVGDEAIVVFWVAKVTRQALLRTHHWLVEGRQAVISNQDVVRNSTVMRAQPLLGRTMACFATDPVFDLVLRAPPPGIDVVGMAFQTNFAVCGI